MEFKVTHVTPQGVKRCMVVRGAVSVAAAMEWVEQLLGPARTLAAIHIKPAQEVQ
ncbi:hypothetical protein [Hydrogenophaga sp.]|uniref:hypothetical protein n=1 Tax=Hydrogenophaga sp. TaxID=1904254 RepID=UPI003D0AB776